MTTVYDVPADALIAATAGKLKEIAAIKAPSWAPFATTGVHKEKPPVEPDWWLTRSAAVLRKVYVQGPIGTERLRDSFGGPKNRGVKPNRAASGSGSVAREALQQLEAAGLIEPVKGKGRRISAAGQKLLDNTAHEVKQKLVEDIPGLAKY